MRFLEQKTAIKNSKDECKTYDEICEVLSSPKLNPLHEDFVQEIYEPSTTKLRFVYSSRRWQSMEEKCLHLFKKQSELKKYRAVKVEVNGEELLESCPVVGPLLI